MTLVYLVFLSFCSVGGERLWAEDVPPFPGRLVVTLTLLIAMLNSVAAVRERSVKRTAAYQFTLFQIMMCCTFICLAAALSACDEVSLAERINEYFGLIMVAVYAVNISWTVHGPKRCPVAFLGYLVASFFFLSRFTWHAYGNPDIGWQSAAHCLLPGGVVGSIMPAVVDLLSHPLR